nr:GNAT family N-acetyltransferase [Phenylobacterium sp.]
MAALPAIERSAAAAFEGRDVPAWLLTDASSPDNWRPQLNAGTLWVAEADGRLVGYLAASVVQDRLHIDEVDVLRACQGRGLGRRLLQTAADHARTTGLRRLSLTTFRDVPWNAPFYASFGFREWPPENAPPSVRQMLSYEAARGLKNRCAMVMDL